MTKLQNIHGNGTYRSSCLKTSIIKCYRLFESNITYISTIRIYTLTAIISISILDVFGLELQNGEQDSSYTLDVRKVRFEALETWN